MNNVFDLLHSDDPAQKIQGIREKDIAIIGMGLNVSQTNQVDQFWNMILNGEELIREIPAERRQDVVDYLNAIGQNKEEFVFEKAAYIDEIDKFDYEFFQISPKEASLMDPNQRMFLETVWSAIEEGGYGGTKLVGTRTGVYVGFSNDVEYKKLILDLEPDVYSIAVTGNLAPIIASRVSYMLDLKGPNMLVNTACSSSLIAVHLACQAIRNGECDMAIAGGTQVHVVPVRHAHVGVESEDNRTKTFDQRSTGTAGGEGVIAILLKPAVKALNDGDHIYGVIKGTAVNHDGTTVGISAPNPKAQEDVVIKAWQDAGIQPETIGYIEAHGTGTRLGDPIEMDGLRRAFEKYTKKKQFCAIGSVKTNVGHLDASAGLLGLVKAVLALKHRRIPPTLHFNQPNASIPFHHSPLYVNSVAKDWKTEQAPRRCGVSSFGFSGTNCHIIMEEAPDRGKPEEGSIQEIHIFTLSAKSSQALERMITQYGRWNFMQHSIDDVCYTANTGRGHYGYRLAVLCTSMEELQERLCLLQNQGSGENRFDWAFLGPPEAHSQKESMGIPMVDMQKLLAKGRTDQAAAKSLCSLYIHGADIDWENLYKGKGSNRVVLPTYSFTRSRCWLGLPDSSSPLMYYEQQWALSVSNSTNTGRQEKIALIHYVKDEHKQLTVALREISAFRVRMDEPDESPIRITEQLVNMGVDRLIIQLPEFDLGFQLIDTDEVLIKAVYPMIQLLSEISRQIQNELKIIFLSPMAFRITGNEDNLQIFHSLIFGAGKAFNIENFQMKCRFIDVDDGTPTDQVIQEIRGESGEYAVAIRKGIRYRQELANVLLDGNGHKLKVRKHGVYVITGGTGDIGIEIARYLASHEPVRLALVSRSGSPQEVQKRSWIHEMERRGSTIICLQADVSDELQMSSVIHQIRSQFGGINGVVHSAGIGVGLKGSMLKDCSLDTFREVLKAKVHGSLLLDGLTMEDNLDFFATFSSPITLTGGAGSASYIAANAFMEAFVEYRNRNGRQTKVIGWAPYEKTIAKSGLPVDMNRQLFRILSKVQLVKGFERVLSSDRVNVIVGEMNQASKIFQLEGHLPFQFSENLKKMFACDPQPKAESEPAVVQEASSVQLRGREDGRYTDAEQYVAVTYNQVLGYNELDIDDDFYELGGDSILAMNAISLINDHFHLKLTLSELLKRPIIKDLAAFIDTEADKSNPELDAPVPIAEPKEAYIASSAQKRLYLIGLNDKVGSSWNISYLVELRGRLDTKRFEQAFYDLIQRHEILRTSIHFIKGELMQKIHPSIDFRIHYIDATEEDAANWQKGFSQRFQLKEAPMFRVTLARIHEKKHMFIFDIDHIISDEISMDVLFHELILLYNGESLPPLRVQYKDFAEWHAALLRSEAIVQQRRYWLEQFQGGTVPALSMPTDFPRENTLSFEGERVTFSFDSTLTKAMKEYIQEKQVTDYWFLMAVFNVVLAKYSSQEDIVVGVPITGRFHPDVEQVMGMFVNVLPLRSFPRGDKTFDQYLDEVKEKLLTLYANQHYPFDRIVEDLKLPILPGRNPIFDVSFQKHIRSSSNKVTTKDGVEFISLPYEDKRSQQDLFLELLESNDEMKFSLVYSITLYRRETMNAFIASIERVAKEILQNRSIRLSEIQLISTEQASSVLDDFLEEIVEIE